MPGPAHRREQLADALLTITAARGLDQVSVREVAAAAGVSIGTVQHYFKTKDEMLVFAFRRLVERTVARLKGIDTSGGVRRSLVQILSQLLPLDDTRVVEGRVYLAFAAQAAVSPTLATIQKKTLNDIHTHLSEVLSRARDTGDAIPGLCPALDARLLLALADGLTLDALSAPGHLTDDQMMALLERHLERLLPDPDSVALSNNK
ncbi:MAG TPA: TetR/AcrR family transcriptional regulator [Pseudonocardiaceae bacterium]